MSWGVQGTPHNFESNFFFVCVFHSGGFEELKKRNSFYNKTPSATKKKMDGGIEDIPAGLPVSASYVRERVILYYDCFFFFSSFFFFLSRSFF